MDVLTAAQMRAIEEAAMSSGEVTGLELMERAGRGVVGAIFERWPEFGPAEAPRPAHSERHKSGTSSRVAVVLCGPGNNGGDGFVVARLLRQQGWEVEVFLYGDREKLPPDARANCERWLRLGSVADWTAFDARRIEADLVLDAVFGTGLTRPVPDEISRQLHLVAGRGKAHPKVVAVDVPSGLCADSGRMLSEEHAASCDLAVTFHRLKLGHVLSEGPRRIGHVAVKDIGLAAAMDERHALLVERRLLDDGIIPPLYKNVSGHKYRHGHALVVSGGPGKTGAARMAARGALRIGAGLVTLACPLRALPEAAAQVTAIMLAGLDGPSGLAEMLEDPRFNAICLGPGLGLGKVTADLVKVVLETARPCVLDADALTRFQRTPESLFDMLHENAVLTPHAGEFSRLFPDLAEKLTGPVKRGPAYSKVDAARDAAARAGCIMLFKGPDTVIAAPDGRASVNSAAYARAAPWLATAGAGDVLAGLITGLLARGFAPMQAAETAAWLHVECARSFGPGLIAEDLAETLPNVLATLQSQG